MLETQQAKLELPRWHCEFESADMALCNEGSGACSGNGFVARRHIPAGTLVMASRAFARSFPLENEFTGNVDASFIVQALMAHPERTRGLYALDAGKAFEGVPPPTDDGVVDVPRIHGMNARNVFSLKNQGTRTSELLTVKHQRFLKKSGRHLGAAEQQAWLAKLRLSEKTGVERELDTAHSGRGLWTRASFFNHSCLPNVEWFVLGDFLFASTLRDVEPDTELCIGYTNPGTSFGERVRKLAQRGDGSDGNGFECLCARCVASRDCGDVLGELEAAAQKVRDDVAARRMGMSKDEAGRVLLELEGLKARLEELPVDVAADALYNMLLAETALPHFPKDIALWERMAELTRRVHGDGSSKALEATIERAVHSTLAATKATDDADIADMSDIAASAMREALAWACVRQWPSGSLSLPQFTDLIKKHNNIESASRLARDLAQQNFPGQIRLEETPYCAYCLEEAAKLMKCSRCRETYCSREHQKKHWKLHKKSCATTTT